jgi:hypothetical protein
MTFFNKKEEVFHIELTPYGRYLKSIGKLMPHHYKFFDDDIAYDSYAISPDRNENSDSVHDRIINETPRIKSNPNVTGVETAINLLVSEDSLIGPELNQNRSEPLDDNINFLQRELGTSKNSSQTSVALKVDLFRGSLTSSEELPLSKFLNSDNTQTLNIPQINVQMQYSFGVAKPDDVVYSYGTYTSNEFDDGKVYYVNPEDPIIRIKQENSLDHKENFTISAFIVESGSTGGHFYRPLNFLHRAKKIQNGLLVEDEDAGSSNDYVDMDLTPNHFEYYFNLNIDGEISEEDICSTIGDLEVRNIYLDKKLKCPDTSTSTTINIYGSRVESSDLEDCD